LNPPDASPQANR